MNDKLFELCKQMISYYHADPKRIQHFIKVHAFAKLIGQGEGISEHDMFILQAAAYTHDIGIKPAEELYGRCDGKLQEKLGGEPAREMLQKIGFESDDINRIVYLIAHHHTYTDISGIDYQILVEADFLVNLYEDNSSKNAVLAAKNNIFRTKTGTAVLCDMFGIK